MGNLISSGGSEIKASACSAGDPWVGGSIPGSGRSPGEGNGNPLQYSCLENPMDRGAWWATVHGVTKGWTWLSDFTFQSSSTFGRILITKGKGATLKRRSLADTTSLELSKLTSPRGDRANVGTTEQSLREKRHCFLLRMCRSLIMRKHEISPNEEGSPVIFQMLKVMRVKERQGSYHRWNRPKRCDI